MEGHSHLQEPRPSLPSELHAALLTGATLWPISALAPVHVPSEPHRGWGLSLPALPPPSPPPPRGTCFMAQLSHVSRLAREGRACQGHSL